jgi:ABC-type lipoprotein release transport system permease subunit
MIGAMGFAGAIMIFYAALLEGFAMTTERNAIGLETGQVQIHAHTYLDDPDIYTTITDPKQILDALDRLGYHSTPRLFTFGLAAAGSSSSGVMLRGVDTVREPLVTSIHEHLKKGSWLDKNDSTGVVIGRKLARIIGVSLEDEIVVVGQAADGSMANELFRVRGILKSVGEGIDRAGFFMTQEAFQTLFLLDEGYHEIVVVPDQAFQKTLAEMTDEIKTVAADYEVKNWRQLRPFLARILDMSNASLMVMLMVTYVAVGILTLNGMLMNVFERMREYGIIKALGMPPWKIFSIISLEAFMQVTIASALAVLVGAPLSLFCEVHPLDLSSLAADSASIAGIAFDPLWYCDLTANSIFLPILFLYLFTIIAIVYPALKASLIRPIKAIYHR